MKKAYNNTPAISYLTISTRSFCNQSKDEQMCVSKKFDSLDFVLWYDETLLDSKVSIHLPVFKYILKCVDDGIITYSGFKNKNYRLACLIFSKFVISDSVKIKNMRDNFISDNPDFFSFKKEVELIDYSNIFKYNHYNCNKRIFPHLYSNGVKKEVISELISRQFISFEENDYLGNLIYICKDNFDYHGLEYHGIGQKHFMRLKGEAFPFVYFKENFENISNDKYVRFEMFDTTLSLLQYISTNEIYDDVLYCSLHTPNFNVEQITNIRKVFGNLPIHFNFENEKQIPEYIAPKESETIVVDIENDSKEDIQKDIPTVKPEYIPFYSEEELIDMKNKNQLTEDIFLKLPVPTEKQFNEIIKMKQIKNYDGKIVFCDGEDETYDIFGNCSELPF